jgi:hypothetical protein
MDQCPGADQAQQAIQPTADALAPSASRQFRPALPAFRRTENPLRDDLPIIRLDPACHREAGLGQGDIMQGIFLSAALAVFTATALANPATDAVHLQAQRKLADWQYRVSETGDHKRVALHDPCKPEGQRWVLESVEGRPATAAEQTKFADMQNKAAKQGKGSLISMIEEASLTPVDGNPNARQWRFSVKPKSVDMVDSDKLVGELTLTADGQVASINIRNPEPFRVMMIEKVEKVAFNMEYIRQAAGIMLLGKSSVEILATGPQDVHQNTYRQYSDFKPGEATASAK